MQVLVLSMFLVSPPMVTAPDSAPTPTRPSKVTVLGRSLVGSTLGAGLSLGLAQGLAGWSNELIAGLAPSVLIGAFGPGVGAHMSLRHSARKAGWHVTRPMLAATAAVAVSSASFAGLVVGQHTSSQSLSVASYLVLGTVMPVAVQWWALEPKP